MVGLGADTGNFMVGRGGKVDVIESTVGEGEVF